MDLVRPPFPPGQLDTPRTSLAGQSSSNSIRQRLRADCGQKQDPDDRMASRGIDSERPITEAKGIVRLGHARGLERDVGSIKFPLTAPR
jgi:hypothetical protein